MIPKVLVIEDSHALRRDIIEMLTFEGFDVQGAENGVLGVQTAREYHPDLIICDIMMPELDGIGVIKELQRDTQESTIPFIFLTAKTDKVDVRFGMELGASDYLTKPFTAPELIAAVRTQLKKRVTFEVLAEERLDDLRENIILTLPHEIRTPLTGILGFADLLVSDSQKLSREKIGEMASFIHTSARRLYRLTENYLAYAQIQMLLQDSERLNAMRDFVTDSPRTRIENKINEKVKEYQREADLTMAIPSVETLPFLEENLDKLIEELIDNALKFSEPGTPITVIGGMKDNQFQLTFADKGRGIQQEKLRRIGAYIQFGREWHEQQGSGFGLIIAIRLSQMHGGGLDIDSKANEGTTVTVTFAPQQSNIALDGEREPDQLVS